MRSLAITLFSVLTAAFGQQLPIEPVTAGVVLYFPQVVDGGDSAQKWQTTFRFLNPNDAAATVTLSFYAENGGPLSLNFGYGADSAYTFTLPARGAITLNSTMASKTTVVGWAAATSTLPVQGSFSHRRTLGTQIPEEVSGDGTKPSRVYVSAATPFLGVAIVNPGAAPVMIEMNLYDERGDVFGSKILSLAPGSHTSFNINHKDKGWPDLQPSFRGTLVIQGTEAGDNFAAWTMHSGSDYVISALPPGRVPLPAPQDITIRGIFSKLTAAAGKLYPDQMASPAPMLEIPADRAISAEAYASGTVRISLGAAELFADSPGDLAALVAHELAHMYQSRSGATSANMSAREYQAEQIGIKIAVSAGYSPYGAAGMLAKLTTALEPDVNLSGRFFEGYPLPQQHSLMKDRLNWMYLSILGPVCTGADVSQACRTYREIYFPHFPDFFPY